MDATDHCVERLIDWLVHRNGIVHAHIVREGGAAQLCLHYDPDQLPLDQARYLAEQAGAEVSNRYRHEAIPFAREGRLSSTPCFAGEVLPTAYTGHNHGSAPGFLPHWMQERWAPVLVAQAGLFLIVGWAGEMFFSLSPQLALALYLLAYLAGGYDIATHAVPALFRGKFDTDVLMLAVASGAAVLGEWQEGAFLLSLFALGHAGEHYALDRARSAVNALGQLMPQTVRVRWGEQIVELPVAQVQVGDVVVVRPGDRVPVDGTVASGVSSVDQSPITGESVPVTKQPGDAVFAGTINHDAALDLRVTRLAQDNTLSRVMKLVAEAQSQQSPTQQLTQRFTR
jgi:Cd2+/Zn2+-exporting ATPase